LVIALYLLWGLVTALWPALGFGDRTIPYFGFGWRHYVTLWERPEFADVAGSDVKARLGLKAPAWARLLTAQAHIISSPSRA